MLAKRDKKLKRKLTVESLSILYKKEKIVCIVYCLRINIINKFEYIKFV